MNTKVFYTALALVLLMGLGTGCSSSTKDYRPLGEPLASHGL